MTTNASLLSLQATATRLITQYGNLYQLVRPTTRGNAIVDVVLIKQIWGTFDKQVAQFAASTGGGVILNSNKTLLVPVIKFGQIEPQPGDKFSYGSNQAWRVKSVDVIRPDSKTTIMYTIEVT